LLIENARIVLTDKGAMNETSVMVSERKIRAIGPAELLRREFGPFEDVIDASYCIVIPGFINNHSHIAMTLLRGLAEDLPLFNWLRDKVWPIESKLKPWQIETGAILGAVECLLSGTTTVNTNYIFDNEGSEASALNMIGMRGVVSHGIFDWSQEKSLRATEDLASRFHGMDQGRIRVATSPHAAYSCSPELLKQIEVLRRELNEKYGRKYPILNTIHAAESPAEAEEINSKYGADARRGIIHYLESLGVLSSDTVCAHSIHLTEDDYSSYKRAGASMASCPVSNLKVGVGVADLPRALSEGVTLSLGTDGAASNNTLDMFETMKLASLLAKGIKGDTTQLSSRVTYELASVGGAKSLRQESAIGSIHVGARADVVLVTLENVSGMPFYDPYNFLVYAARSCDVRDVLVDGRLIVKNRAVQTVDLENLRKRLDKAVEEIQDTAK
jgi:5-methylthioadenosine/S-adenosylhomocysteine deaminase